MENNFSKGAISRILLILAALVLVVIVIVYFSLNYIKGQKSANTAITPTQNSQTAATVQSKVPAVPVYETQVGDIKFFLEYSADLGTILPATSKNQQPLTTGGRFIKVIISAQNKGKIDTTNNAWTIRNLIDSDGRIFTPDGNQVNPFLPQQNQCGAVLKPEFDPIPCAKIYEVSKESAGLKVEVLNFEQKVKGTVDLNLQ